MQKLKFLIFFLGALTEGSSLITSGSAFHIDAPVNVKLFLNVKSLDYRNVQI